MIFPIGNRWSSGKSRLRRARLQLILVAFVLSGMVACFQSAASAAVDAAFLKNVSPADAQILIGQNAVDPSFIVLDVRTPPEFLGGHIAGAIDVDYLDASFSDRIAALDAAASYLVYCESGHRSGPAAQMMHRSGFTRIYSLEGGFSAWVAAGLLAFYPGSLEALISSRLSSGYNCRCQTICQNKSGRVLIAKRNRSIYIAKIISVNPIIIVIHQIIRGNNSLCRGYFMNSV